MSQALVTQSFGHEREYRRAILMIWSFFAHASRSLRVILFTDAPGYFKPYFVDQPVEYVLLTAVKIQEMSGKINFLHRMKIGLIEEAFQMCKGNILYADSDTFFTADPFPLLEKLSPRVAFMHQHEHKIESLKDMALPAGTTFRAFYELIREKEFALADGSPLRIDFHQSSWNAGVMLLHESHAGLLPDVYALTDQFYPATTNHASEQYAFSIVLQNGVSLYSCEEVIYHYWYRVKKAVVDLLLVRRLALLRAHPSHVERIEIVRKWTSSLPNELNEHVFILRDNAIQAFNEGNFRQGYLSALHALLKEPFDIVFLRHLGYHTKRWLKSNLALSALLGS